MGQHQCSCGREFKCAETLRRHGAITGHPPASNAVAVLASLEAPVPPPAPTAPPAPVRDSLEQSIEWAMQVIAKKRAEQESYERELLRRAARPVSAPGPGLWSLVKSLVGLAA